MVASTTVDNAEHVREAAPAAELVARAPRVTVLVTSRAVLHVSGERVFSVSPFAVSDAVELFVQRAKLLDPSFERTPQNEDDINEICTRVDCLPLAIELAAARIRISATPALRERLDVRLSVLTSGPRDLPTRQQTLRGTIAWSVGLLDERARAVFARSVFPGGVTLDAVAEVCGADLDVLSALVDDHLVQPVHGGERLVRHELGDHQASRRDFEEARACFEEIGFRQQVAYALQGLAAGLLRE